MFVKEDPAEDYLGEDDPFARDEDIAGTTRSKEIQALDCLRDNMDLPCLRTQSPSCVRTPVFLGHGSADDRVHARLGEEAGATLAALGIGVTLQIYQGSGHWYKEPDEIDDIVDFLAKEVGIVSSTLAEKGLKLG